jgi:peptidoglycan/xylan/chitin deacetylase (PgdA/CDA1 family)
MSTRETAGASERTPPLKPRAYYTAVGLLEKVTSLRQLRTGVVRATGVRILCYHRVSRDRDVLAVSPDAFRRQLDAVRASGARVLRLDAALELFSSPVEDFCVCVTLDDGYRDALEIAAPILREFDVPATVYLPTAMIDGTAPYDWYGKRKAPPALDWDGARELIAGGLIDVQAHTRTHARLTALDDDTARWEFETSKADIERNLGVTVTSISYPAGLYGPRDVRLVHETGYRAAVTCRSGLNASGVALAELRRTLIGPRDDIRRFRAKLDGQLDAPTRLTEAMQRRRGRPKPS